MQALGYQLTSITAHGNKACGKSMKPTQSLPYFQNWEKKSTNVGMNTFVLFQSMGTTLSCIVPHVFSTLQKNRISLYMSCPHKFFKFPQPFKTCAKAAPPPKMKQNVNESYSSESPNSDITNSSGIWFQWSSEFRLDLISLRGYSVLAKTCRTLYFNLLKELLNCKKLETASTSKNVRHTVKFQYTVHFWHSGKWVCSLKWSWHQGWLKEHMTLKPVQSLIIVSYHSNKQNCDTRQ